MSSVPIIAASADRARPRALPRPMIAGVALRQCPRPSSTTGSSAASTAPATRRRVRARGSRRRDGVLRRALDSRIVVRYIVTYCDGHKNGCAMRRGSPGPRFGDGPMFGGGRPFAGPPFGGGRGRKRRGDVRAALLLLLAEEPRNGYQLMQAIEERSGGRWRPSPGSVYPTLAQLEDEGLIRSTERDGHEAVRDHRRRPRARSISARHEGAPWEVRRRIRPSSSDDDLESLIKQVAHRRRSQVAQAGDEHRSRGPARCSPRPGGRCTGSWRRTRSD